MILKCFFVFLLVHFIEAKNNLTLDAFFNYTSFRALSSSPDGQYLLIHSRQPAWNRSIFQNNLWLFEPNQNKKTLITERLFEGTKLQWSPSGNLIVFLENDLSSNEYRSKRSNQNGKNLNKNQYISLYSIKSRTTSSILVGTDFPLAISWSSNDSSIFYAVVNDNSNKLEDRNTLIEYETSVNCTVRQIIFNSTNNMSQPIKTVEIVTVPFLIGDLVYAPIQHKLFFSSIFAIVENGSSMEIFSYNLNTHSAIEQLTTDGSLKQNLQLSSDFERVFFQNSPLTSSPSEPILTQPRLFAIDLSTNTVEHWASDFQGTVTSYTTAPNGSVFFVGQIGTNTEIYSQRSKTEPSVYHQGFSGSYLLISTAWYADGTAFVFTSFTKALEVYFASNISQITSAVQLTNENVDFDQYDIPLGEIFRWQNKDDNRTIEGTLLYPPGQFQQKNLPLLVLIHGGPSDASLNCFLGNWYTWGPLAAAAGWLVFEPNYRGSTGYGDEFLNEIRYKPLSRPGKDILDGVDQLISDGIVDETKLSIGGYSYGGVLTNWLITQTTRFNAALSGAGSIEQVSFWGTTDIPVYIDYLFGGFPWETPEIYKTESAIYQIDKIRTPTHIVSGEDDVRVPFSQNLMLARAIRYVGVPVKLLLIPDEGHPMGNNPWHGKLKVQDELFWLEKYGLNRKQ